MGTLQRFYILIGFDLRRRTKINPRRFYRENNAWRVLEGGEATEEAGFAAFERLTGLASIKAGHANAISVLYDLLHYFNLLGL